VTRISLLVSVALLLASASCTQKNPSAAACIPAQTTSCLCPGGSEGTQTCDASGVQFGACQCSSLCPSGTSCAVMPSLVGQDIDAASAALTAVNLSLPDPVDATAFIVVEQINDPPVQVLAQSPAPGTPVAPGTRVVLTVTLPPDQESLGLPNSNFLVGKLGQDSALSADAYYRVLDPGPNPTRATFAQWRAAVGFGTPADSEASATYETHNDLGFGRVMHMRRKGKHVAFYVENFPDLHQAVAGSNYFATVAMEYGPGPGGKETDPFFTQFYVFNKKGLRVTEASLDDHGPKAQPAVCLSCHGGTVSDPTYLGSHGNLGARFIPFNVDEELFSDRPGYRRADQEAAFKAFNEAVQATYDPADPAYPPGDPAPVIELVDNWYGGPGHPSAVFDGSKIPSGWDVSPEARAIYKDVYGRTCQTCHAQRESSRNFSTYAKFVGEKALIDERVFMDRAMPLSQRGSLNFWLSSPNQPKLLAAWLGTAYRAPGKPIAHALAQHDGANVGTSSQVTLDATTSQFASSFAWQQTAGESVTLTNATADGAKTTFTAPSTAMTLTFRLVASRGSLVSDPLDLNILVQGVPTAPIAVLAMAGVGSATVTWTAPANNGGTPIIGYTISASPGGATTQVSGSTTLVIFNGLTPGTSYTFTVVAANMIGSGKASHPTVPVFVPTVPGRVTGVSATPLDSAAQLVWTVPGDGGGTISSYTITPTPAAGPPVVVTAPAAGGSFPGLVNGTSYTFTVSATNQVGAGPASAASTPVIPVGLPTAPQSLTALAQSDGSVNLSWSPPANDGGYAVDGYYVSWTPGTGNTFVTVAPSPSTPLNINGLVNGTNYTFSVAAHNSLGTGPVSSSSTTPAAPGAPLIISAAPGATSITVNWSAASSNGSSISMYTVTASGATPVVVGGNVLTTTINGLSNCTAYTITVTAANVVGSTDSAPYGPVTPVQAPDVVSQPTVTQNVQDLSVVWTPPATYGCAISYYWVQVTNPDFSVSNYFPTTNAFDLPNISACSYPSANCSNPSNWSFTVSATTGGGSSAGPSPSSGQFRPLVSYSGDNIVGIWNANTGAASGGTCLLCHSTGGPGAVGGLNFSGAAGASFNSIKTTPGVIGVTPGTSYLILCPTWSGAQGNVCVTMANHRFNYYSTEFWAIYQWLQDGAKF